MNQNKEKIKIERTYRASIDEMWALWTTKDGFESWWGPEGFKVKVHKLDLRPGGQIHYSMIAVGPEQIKFMKESGMPVEHEVRHTYIEIVPKRRLAQTHAIDFVPNVKPYTARSVVEFEPKGEEVRMVVTLDQMHSEEWTRNATMGWESQLTKVPNALKEISSRTGRKS